MRVLLDTNIVYDLLCARPFDQEGLMQLRVMHAFSDVELWVSAKSYADLFYLIRKELGSAAAQDLLEETLSWLKVCSVDGEDVAAAFAARWQDFEDCLINRCAEKTGADYLITRDANGFKKAGMPVGGASEFMQFVFDTTGVTYDTENLPLA
ncbi:MAG: PIN domain-containing protein [Coriobacteriia bacterium]|nr:PIN domain-containing protein [Coriobacteriia bacterium]